MNEQTKSKTKQKEPFLGAPGWLSGVKRLTLDFGSGHGLAVQEFEPLIQLCADSLEPALDSLSPFLSVPLLLVLSCSQKINIKKKETKKQTLFMPTGLRQHLEAAVCSLTVLPSAINNGCWCSVQPPRIALTHSIWGSPSFCIFHA